MVLFAANSEDDTISIVSLETLREIDKIPLPAGKRNGPRRLSFYRDSLYCINAYSGTLCRIKEKQTEVFPVGAYPNGIACFYDRLLICCGESDSLWSYDETGSEVISLRAFPSSVTAFQNRVVCTNMLSSEVTVLAKDLTVIKRLPITGMPMYAVMDEQERIFCTHSAEYAEHGFLSVFEKDGKLLQRIPVGIMPTTVRFFGDKAVVANTGNSTIHIVNCQSLLCERIIPLGNMPDDIAVCPESEMIFISSMMENCIYALSFEGKIIQRIPVGNEPRGLALSR